VRCAAGRQRDELDRWILADLHTLIRDVTNAYETYNVRLTRRVQAFVEDLSNWYLRPFAPPFWKTGVTATSCRLPDAVRVPGERRQAARAGHAVLSKRCTATCDPVDATRRKASTWRRGRSPNPAMIDQPVDGSDGAGQAVGQPGHAARTASTSGAAAAVRGDFAVRTPAVEGAALARLHHRRGVEWQERQRHGVGGRDDPLQPDPLPQKLGKRLGANFPKIQKMLREGSEAEVSNWAALLLSGQNS